jgi:RNA polymerase sigma-70 factor (ECF subfamily)
VARRRALNLMRRQRTEERKLPLLLDEPPPAGSDDRLQLVFMCCHPALAREAQVALTLRLVCGVDTPTCTRRAPTCCGGWAATPRRRTPIAPRSS